MSELTTKEPFEILETLKENLKNDPDLIKDVFIGFAPQAILSQAMTDRIVITPISDYFTNQGISAAREVKEQTFSYSINILIKSRAGEFPFKKFIEWRRICVKQAFNTNLDGLGKRVLSQEANSYFSWDFVDTVKSDLWTCTITMTCKLR